MMLGFACWQVDDEADDWERGRWPPLSAEEQVRAVIQGRANLFYRTEQDFGFSLRDWRHYLIEQALQKPDPYGYGHPYAAHGVDRAVVSMINHPGRPALEAQAAAAEGTIEPVPEYWWPGETKRGQIDR